MDGARVSEILASILLIFTDRYVSVAGGEIQMENRNWKITGEMFFFALFYFVKQFFLKNVLAVTETQLNSLHARFNVQCALHLKAFGPQRTIDIIIYYFPFTFTTDTFDSCG